MVEDDDDVLLAEHVCRGLLGVQGAVGARPPLQHHHQLCADKAGDEGEKEARKRRRRRVLTAPERVGEPAVDPAVQLLVDGPEDARAQLDEVDDEAADHKDEAHEQLQDEQALQVGQKSHGRGARGAGEAPLFTTTNLGARET